MLDFIQGMNLKSSAINQLVHIIVEYVMDMWQALLTWVKTYFIAPPSKVTLGQMTDVVIKYMNENPAQLHKSADSIVVSAISKDFPCGKR